MVINILLLYEYVKQHGNLDCSVIVILFRGLQRGLRGCICLADAVLSSVCLLVKIETAFIVINFCTAA